MKLAHLAVLGFFAFASVAARAAQAPAPKVLPLSAPRQLTLEDAVPGANGYHQMVILRGLNKTTGRATDINAPIGIEVRFGTLSIVARYCHTTPPEEPPETAAFLQIDDNPPGSPPKRIFSGWMFASSPALNPLEHAVYDVWVITCKTDAPQTSPPPPADIGTPADETPGAAAPNP